VASAAGFLWTGRALRQRRKDGWFSAFITAGCLLLPNALGKEMSWVSLLEVTLGIIALISVRNELE
jgi:hypothetical protein